jgi:hypothetical protein
MALQPFFGPWPLFQFLDPLHSRLDFLDGGSARRKAHSTTRTNNNCAHNTDIHALNGIPAFERAKTVHALDRVATVIGRSCN